MLSRFTFQRVARLALVSLAAAACGSSASAPSQTPQPLPAQEEAEAPSQQSQISLRAALASYEAFNTKDFVAFKALIAPSLVRKQIDGERGEPEGDYAAYMEWFHTFAKALPNGKVIPLIALANGDQSAVLYLTDTSRGARFVFAESSEHDAEGRITQIREHGDNLTMYHQFGVRPDKDAPGPEPEWKETFAVAATGSEQEARNTELVKKLFEADAAADPERAAALVTDDFLFRVVPLTFKTNGKAELIEALKTRHSFVDSSFVFESAWGAGDWVVLEYETTTVFKKGPAQGKTLTSHAIVFTRVEGDKLAELYLVYNNAFNSLKLGLISEAELTAAREKLLKMAAEAEQADSPTVE